MLPHWRTTLPLLYAPLRFLTIFSCHFSLRFLLSLPPSPSLPYAGARASASAVGLGEWVLCALNRFASKLKHFKIYTHNCQKCSSSFISVSLSPPEPCPLMFLKFAFCISKGNFRHALGAPVEEHTNTHKSKSSRSQNVLGLKTSAVLWYLWSKSTWKNFYQHFICNFG